MEAAGRCLIRRLFHQEIPRLEASSSAKGLATECEMTTNVGIVGFGSKREELSVSKSRPLYPAKRTLARRAATSPMGQQQKLLPIYSITSSAWTSSVCGTSIPCDLAVLRLMTNSNFVG